MDPYQYRPMHIGKRIKEIVDKQGRRPTWLAQQLHTVRPNVYSIFRRESIDTELLQRLSIILNYNFLQDLAQETAQQLTPQQLTPEQLPPQQDLSNP